MLFHRILVLKNQIPSRMRHRIIPCSYTFLFYQILCRVIENIVLQQRQLHGVRSSLPVKVLDFWLGLLPGLQYILISLLRWDHRIISPLRIQYGLTFSIQKPNWLILRDGRIQGLRHWILYDCAGSQGIWESVIIVQLLISEFDYGVVTAIWSLWLCETDIIQMVLYLSKQFRVRSFFFFSFVKDFLQLFFENVVHGQNQVWVTMLLGFAEWRDVWPLERVFLLFDTTDSRFFFVTQKAEEGLFDVLAIVELSGFWNLHYII